MAEPRRIVVFDIDGVLADVSHRLHHIGTRPKNWRAFFAAADADPPLQEGIDLANRLSAEHEVLYLTGRPESLRSVTQEWLERHGLPEGRLVMRRGGDFRPARVAKLDLLASVGGHDRVHAMVDDDPAVVEALTEAGYAVLHATWAPTSEHDPRLRGRTGRSAPAGSQQQTLWEAQEEDGRT